MLIKRGSKLAINYSLTLAMIYSVLGELTAAYCFFLQTRQRCGYSY